MPIDVLMLDDEPDYGELFVDAFSSASVVIRTFVDPAAAVAAASAHRPDLIFLDFRLPQMTANDVAPKMPANVPIYILTGELNPNITFSCQGIITKPFKKQDILAQIEKIAAMARA